MDLALLLVCVEGVHEVVGAEEAVKRVSRKGRTREVGLH